MRTTDSIPREHQPILIELRCVVASLFDLRSAKVESSSLRARKVRSHESSKGQEACVPTPRKSRMTQTRRILGQQNRSWPHLLWCVWHMLMGCAYCRRRGSEPMSQKGRTNEPDKDCYLAQVWRRRSVAPTSTAVALPVSNF